MSAGYGRVVCGLDVEASAGFASLRGQKVGAIVNPTATDRKLRHLADLLMQTPHVTLVKLFAPEHGIRSDAQDQIGSCDEIDKITRITVRSLYGSDVAGLTPSAADLEGLDALVFDIQDVGSRYYTFAATMQYAMVAAADAGLRFVVLDRPNPLGGQILEGPTVQPGYASFVGAHPMPIRHGMTVGELARMFQAELRLDLDLTVIPCQNWRRTDIFSVTGLPWVLPSPNMPTPDTALVYPGACLWEGTNISEGRGSTRPFELFGAPEIDIVPMMQLWDQAVRIFSLSGVLLRPCGFLPTFHKYAGKRCLGGQIHVTDPDRFTPVQVYTILLALVRKLIPEHFAWRTETYEFVSNPIAIDLLYGSSRERLFLESEDIWLNPDMFADLVAIWRRDEAEFRERRRPFLLYPEESLFPRVAVAMNADRPALPVLLRVEGAVETPLELTRQDLEQFPAVDQVEDVSRFHPGRPGDAVTLAALLRRARIKPDADYLTLHAGRDDFHVSVPLAAVFSQGLIVYRVGQSPLTVERGGPIRFLIQDPAACHTHELDDCANVKFLERIELTVGKGQDTRPSTDDEHEALHARQNP